MKKFKLTWQHFLFCILIIAILGALVNYLYFNEDNINIETLQNMDNTDNKFPKNYFKGSPADGIDDFQRETGMTCTPYKSVTGSGEKPSLFEGINACREDKDCTGLLWVSQLHQNARDKAEKKGNHREGASYLCNKPLQNIVGFKPKMGDAIAYLKSGLPHGNDPSKSGVPNPPQPDGINPITKAAMESSTPSGIESVSDLKKIAPLNKRVLPKDETLAWQKQDLSMEERNKNLSQEKGLPFATAETINYSESLPRTARFGIEGGQTAIRDTDNISGEQEQSATFDVVNAFSGNKLSNLGKSGSISDAEFNWIQAPRDNYPGNDMVGDPPLGSSLDACKATCAADAGCKGIVYGNHYNLAPGAAGNQCFKKSDMSRGVSGYPGFKSYYKKINPSSTQAEGLKLSASELEELKRSKDKDNVFGKMGKETKLGKGGNLAKEGFTNLSYSSINNQGPLNCPDPLTPYEKYNCGPVNVNNIFGNIQFKPECCGNPAGSSYSNSMGCACICPEQWTFLNSRGGNRTFPSEF